MDLSDWLLLRNKSPWPVPLVDSKTRKAQHLTRLLTQNSRTRPILVHGRRCHGAERVLPLSLFLRGPSTPPSKFTLFLLLLPSPPRALLLRRMRCGSLQSLCIRRSQRLPLPELPLRSTQRERARREEQVRTAFAGYCIKAGCLLPF